MERGKIHVHPESWECNGCFLSWCSMLLIASGSSRKNVCGLGWTSVHYPSKHKGPKAYTPIDKTVGRGGGG